jgi:hypothetical protein
MKRAYGEARKVAASPLEGPTLTRKLALHLRILEDYQVQ